MPSDSPDAGNASALKSPLIKLADASQIYALEFKRLTEELAKQRETAEQYALRFIQTIRNFESLGERVKKSLRQRIWSAGTLGTIQRLSTDLRRAGPEQIQFVNELIQNPDRLDAWLRPKIITDFIQPILNQAGIATVLAFQDGVLTSPPELWIKFRSTQTLHAAKGSVFWSQVIVPCLKIYCPSRFIEFSDHYVAEYADCTVALDLLIQLLRGKSIQIDKSTVARRGRHKLVPAEEARRVEVLEAWKKAKAKSVKKSDFCEEQKPEIKVATLDKYINWHTQRQKRGPHRNIR